MPKYAVQPRRYCPSLFSRYSMETPQLLPVVSLTRRLNSSSALSVQRFLPLERETQKLHSLIG